MDRNQVPNSSAESRIKEDRSLALRGCSPVSPATLRCAEVRWGSVEVEHALFPRELTAICQGQPGKEYTYCMAMRFSGSSCLLCISVFSHE